MAAFLGKTFIFQLTIAITTAGDGDSVQQRLSVAAMLQPLASAAGATDKLYSLCVGTGASKELK